MQRRSRFSIVAKSFSMPAPLYAELARLARARNWSRSQVVRAALRAYFDSQHDNPAPPPRRGHRRRRRLYGG